MKSKSGFTIIELLVVITVIVLLVTISAVAYSKIQNDGRDAKRKSDIVLLANLFEKYYERNGEYPTGCSKYEAARKLSCTTQYSSTSNNQPTNNPDAFYADTPLSTLRSVFPELPESFGNPSRPGDPPLKGYASTVTPPGYFYRGEIRNIAATNLSSTTMSATYQNEIDCGSGITVYQPTFGSSSGGTAFILGYWSEASKQWFIYQGKRGQELTLTAWNTPVRGTTQGKCVFVQ